MKRNRNLDRPLYILINEIGFERFRIQLICDFPCEDKYQDKKRVSISESLEL